jgi:hypothetical protein
VSKVHVRLVATVVISLGYFKRLKYSLCFMHNQVILRNQVINDIICILILMRRAGGDHSDQFPPLLTSFLKVFPDTNAKAPSPAPSPVRRSCPATPR